MLVTEHSIHRLSPEVFLPSWTQRRFVVLDMSNRWAHAISAQVSERLQQTDAEVSDTCPVFDSCHLIRDVLLLCEAKNTVGAVLFISGIERECLNMLARLARWAERPVLLAVCNEKHEGLLPILMESGVDSVFFDVDNDVMISDWCVRVLVTQSDQ